MSRRSSGSPARGDSHKHSHLTSKPYAQIHGSMRNYEPEEALIDDTTIRIGIPLVKDLLVRCWCEAEELKVPQPEVRAGRTASCGRPSCQAPEGGEQ